MKLSKGKEYICKSEIFGELVNDMIFSKDELMSQTLTKPLVVVLLRFKRWHISFNNYKIASPVPNRTTTNLHESLYYAIGIILSKFLESNYNKQQYSSNIISATAAKRSSGNVFGRELGLSDDRLTVWPSGCQFGTPPTVFELGSSSPRGLWTYPKPRNWCSGFLI